MTVSRVPSVMFPMLFHPHTTILSGNGYRYQDLSSSRNCVCAQSRLTLCNPLDCSMPGSSVHGIFQARTLEWVAISFSGGSSLPKPTSPALQADLLLLSHQGSPFLETVGWTIGSLLNSDTYRIIPWFLRGHMSPRVCLRVILPFIPQVYAGYTHTWHKCEQDTATSLLQSLVRNISFIPGNIVKNLNPLNPLSLFLILLPQNKVILMVHPFLQRTHLRNENNSDNGW